MIYRNVSPERAWGYTATMNRISHNNQPKAAVINDFSGFGRCSIAVSLPILSAMKVQCCAVPTAIFSNHTGFESFFVEDYTDRMESYVREWKKLDLRFGAIASGFLGSSRQIQIVEKFILDFRDENTSVVIDPVMGDYGRLYPTYKTETAVEMKSLVRYADILTPNLTEACILTGETYRESPDTQFLKGLCRKLTDNGGAQKIVITGLDRGDEIENFIYQKGDGFSEVTVKKAGEQRSGTGDVFSSIVTAGAVRGFDFTRSVELAADFIAKAIRRSAELEIPVTDGVCFEEILGELALIEK